MALEPGLVTDTDTFHAPEVLPPLAAGHGFVLYSGDFVTYGGDYVVAPGLFPKPGLVADGDVIHAPAVSTGIAPGLVTDADSIYSPAAISQSIAAGLVTDGDTLPAPTVGMGLIYVNLPLLTDADTFHAPEIMPPLPLGYGYVVYSGDFVTYSGDFVIVKFMEMLEPGAIADADSIPAPTVTHGLQAGLFVDGDSFPAPELGGLPIFLVPQRVVDVDMIYPPMPMQFVERELIEGSREVPRRRGVVRGRRPQPRAVRKP